MGDIWVHIRTESMNEEIGDCEDLQVCEESFCRCTVSYFADVAHKVAVAVTSPGELVEIGSFEEASVVEEFCLGRGEVLG